jgi:oxalate decarboxylase
MNGKQYDAILESLSRRKFLRTGSAALAMTALAGATALGQERPNTKAAEHDHSSNDPGQENKPLLDENPDSNTPPPTDHGDMVPLWYSFDLTKKRVEEGGWTHEVTQRELPSSKDIAGVNMRLTAGSYRELHWHTADEWAYVLYGKARVTVMSPDGKMFIGDVSEGDLWLFPAGHPHSIQGLDPDGTEFLLVFNQGDFSENGTMLLSEWMAHTPPEVLMKNFGLDREALAKLPTEALYIFPGTVPTNTVAQDKEEIGGSAVGLAHSKHLQDEIDGPDQIGQTRRGAHRRFPQLPPHQGCCSLGHAQARRAARAALASELLGVAVLDRRQGTHDCLFPGRQRSHG